MLAYTQGALSSGLLLSLTLVAFAFGMGRVEIVAHVDRGVLGDSVGSKVTIEGIVSAEPDERERTTRVVILPVRVNESAYDGKAKVLVVTWRPVEILYGQKITVIGILEEPSSFEADGGRTFNYPGYLAKDGVFYELSFPEVQVGGGGGVALSGILFNIKNAYLEGLSQVLPEPHAALAGGITVGDKRALGGELTDLFRITGIIHIVVLSGYNITIIADTIRRLFSFAPRVVGWWGAGISILLFVLMTGASATGVRAGAMAGLGILAQITNRPYAITRALLITAVLMVFWSPYTLLFDPGFQLSFIATLGLIHIAPRIEAWFSWVPEHLGLRGIVGATIGTQIAVMPLILYQMGLLSVVALPVNLLVLPVIPIAMLLSMVAGLAGIGSATLGTVLAFPVYVLLEYTLRIVEWSSKIPFASVSVDAFSVWWVALSYAIMLGILWQIAPPPQSSLDS